MRVVEILRERAGLIVSGLVSFLVALALFRWSTGQDLIQPSADAGVAIGAAMVTLYLVLNDTRGEPTSQRGRQTPRAPELN